MSKYLDVNQLDLRLGKITLVAAHHRFLWERRVSALFPQKLLRADIRQAVAESGLGLRSTAFATMNSPLDPGALGVFPECLGTYLSVQIYWPEGDECPLPSTVVPARLNSWLDSWLDPGSFQGRVTMQFRWTDDEVFELRLGDEQTISQTISWPANPSRFSRLACQFDSEAILRESGSNFSGTIQCETSISLTMEAPIAVKVTG